MYGPTEIASDLFYVSTEIWTTATCKSTRISGCLYFNLLFHVSRYYEKSLSSDGQQFLQYQQHKQLFSPQIIEHTQKAWHDDVSKVS
jgi:hypothetical protein